VGGPPPILADTHALICLAEGHPYLGDRARHIADKALAHDDLGVSAITFWEIAMLHQRGRIQLMPPVGAWRQRLID
jgi:PIN domain nuclease of toxin-antitoxin system